MTASSIRNPNFSRAFKRLHISRGLMFGVLIICALLAFEMFNYSTTDFALADLLGDLDFVGVRWATILAIAFCGIDFAGIARLFTPEQGADEPAEVWYLFGAWLLAATMNAMLTWWGVSIAILNHNTLGNAVVDRQTLIRVVPIFVAILVWLIRVLIIGTFSVAGDRLFSQASAYERRSSRASRSVNAPALSPSRSLSTRATPTYKPAPKVTAPSERNYVRPEPTYHPVSMTGYNGNNSQSRR